MMTYTIIAALLPVVLLLFYIYRKDRLQPEPIRWLWRAVMYGVGSALLTITVLSPIPSLSDLSSSFAATIPGAIVNAFCYAAMPEEAAKLLMLWLLIRKNPYFDEHLDGIVYATYVGLGFAGLENIMYLASNTDQLMTVAVSRALFSVPGHFFFAVAMGYFLSLAYFRTENKGFYYCLAYLVPVVSHGIFDALLMSVSVANSLAGLLIIAFLVFVHFLRKKGLQRIEALRSISASDLFSSQGGS